MPLKCKACGECHTARRGCADAYAMLERMAGPMPEPKDAPGEWVLECGKHHRPYRACCEGHYTLKWEWQDADPTPPPVETDAGRAQMLEAELRVVRAEAHEWRSAFGEATNLRYTPGPEGGVHMDMPSPEWFVQYTAEMMAHWVMQGPGNSVEWRIKHDECGPMVLTLQRVEGKTPAEQRLEAEQERDTALARLATAEAENGRLRVALKRIATGNHRFREESQIARAALETPPHD